jgi:hypothetical protein
MAEALTLPEGEYAIVECLGHRTLVGRVAEVERFGTKMLSVEPLFQDKLLPAQLIGGGALYAFTPCTAEVARARQPKNSWQLPPSIVAALPPEALPAPAHDEDEGGPEPEFAPRFLSDDEEEF